MYEFWLGNQLIVEAKMVFLSFLTRAAAAWLNGLTKHWAQKSTKGCLTKEALRYERVQTKAVLNTQWTRVEFISGEFNNTLIASSSSQLVFSGRFGTPKV